MISSSFSCCVAQLGCGATSFKYGEKDNILFFPRNRPGEQQTVLFYSLDADKLIPSQMN